MRSALAHHWSLDPDVVFLNHGSFGACPIAVLQAQQELRAQLEREPVQFLARELEGRLDAARGVLGEFLGADPDDLAFVPNATTGIGTVLRSLRLTPGDEIVTTNHVYNACRNAAATVAAQTGAHVIVARIPFPLAGPGEVVESVLAAVTPRTRLVLVEHVTSPTGLIFPVAGLVTALADRGVRVLIDGAHAPGMLPVDLEALGADYYTANCHKWICAPKGAAFLHVRRDRQEEVHPLVISHGANAVRAGRSRFRLEFDWTGTMDPTSFLCVPEAIRYMNKILPGGWPEVMDRNHALVLEARRVLCAALEIDTPCPNTMLGSLASIPLPPGDGRPAPPEFGDLVQKTLWDEHRIDVPFFTWPASPKRLLRISAQLYNSIEEYSFLAKTLVTELRR